MDHSSPTESVPDEEQSMFPPKLPALQVDDGTQQQHLRRSKRKLTSQGMAPLPPPKKARRKRSSSLSSLSKDPSSLDNEPNEPISRPRSPAVVAESHKLAGLQYPPPRYNMEGKWNRSKTNGRRRYSVKARKLLPFHHQPFISIDDRPVVSNSADQVIEYIDDEVDLLKGCCASDGVDRSEEGRALLAVRSFVEESADLQSWDPSRRRRSLDARMEDLLVRYGYDKMRREPPSDCKGEGEGRE